MHVKYLEKPESVENKFAPVNTNIHFGSCCMSKTLTKQTYFFINDDIQHTAEVKRKLFRCAITIYFTFKTFYDIQQIRINLK